jgi:hypothetical protein
MGHITVIDKQRENLLAKLDFVKDNIKVVA